MERAARKAGGRLRRDFGEVEHLQVSRKGPADFVSKADMRAERTIYDELLHARPDWGFVMEEAGIIEGSPDKPRWIVDPLDGTSNFLHGIPHFAISIAVQEPRLDGKNAVLWFGGPLLLIIGGFVAFRTLSRQRKPAATTTGQEALTDEEREKLDELLKG